MKNNLAKRVQVLLLGHLLFLISCEPNKEVNKRVDFDKAISLYKKGRKEVKKDTLKAIEYFTKAAHYGFEPRQAYSEAIYYNLLLNKLDKAMQLSLKLADHGFRDFSQMESHPFTELAKHPDWNKLKQAILTNHRNYEKSHNDLDSLKVVTFDIDNFWRAYDMAEKENDFKKKTRNIFKRVFPKGI